MDTNWGNKSCSPLPRYPPQQPMAGPGGHWDFILLFNPSVLHPFNWFYEHLCNTKSCNKSVVQCWPFQPRIAIGASKFTSSIIIPTKPKEQRLCWHRKVWFWCIRQLIQFLVTAKGSQGQPVIHCKVGPTCQFKETYWPNTVNYHGLVGSLHSCLFNHNLMMFCFASYSGITIFYKGCCYSALNKVSLLTKHWPRLFFTWDPGLRFWSWRGGICFIDGLVDLVSLRRGRKKKKAKKDNKRKSTGKDKKRKKSKGGKGMCFSGLKVCLHSYQARIV